MGHWWVSDLEEETEGLGERCCALETEVDELKAVVRKLVKQVAEMRKALANA